MIKLKKLVSEYDLFANIKDYDARVAAGKRIEQKILHQLRSRGYKILDPTEHEDKYDKIDGWWVAAKTGKKYSVQIKYRQRGDDILYEIIRDVDANREGRDLKGKATLYLVAQANGFTRLLLTEPMKNLGYKIKDLIMSDLKKNPSKTKWEGKGWVAIVQYDRANGDRKAIAYFDPSMFQEIGHWQLKL